MPETLTSTLTARRLPTAEWGKLAGTELAYLADLHLPETDALQVFVVEQDGQIVACWSRMMVVHVEGLWIAEPVRGRAGVGRLLFDTMIRSLRADGVPQVYTQAIDDSIAAMLAKIGGSPVPGQTWAFPIPQED